MVDFKDSNTLDFINVIGASWKAFISHQSSNLRKVTMLEDGGNNVGSKFVLAYAMRSTLVILPKMPAYPTLPHHRQHNTVRTRGGQQRAYSPGKETVDEDANVSYLMISERAKRPAPPWKPIR